MGPPRLARHRMRVAKHLKHRGVRQPEPDQLCARPVRSQGAKQTNSEHAMVDPTMIPVVAKNTLNPWRTAGLQLLCQVAEEGLEPPTRGL